MAQGCPVVPFTLSASECAMREADAAADHCARVRARGGHRAGVRGREGEPRRRSRAAAERGDRPQGAATVPHQVPRPAPR